MGPMLLLVIGILGAVGLGIFQFGEQHRFEMVSDAKGGIFVIDKKSAMINYCNDKTCSLVGNGALPSHIMNNPAALASMQGAIMGAPAAPSPARPGQAPDGMQQNLATSGVSKPAVADAADTAGAHDSEAENHADTETTEDTQLEHPDADEHHDAPEGFNFSE